MSVLVLERAVYRLSLSAPEVAGREPREALAALRELSGSPAAAFAWIDLRLELAADERDVIERGDVAEMYRRGVHPIVIRNFAGRFGIDYVDAYERAGLR